MDIARNGNGLHDDAAAAPALLLAGARRAGSDAPRRGAGLRRPVLQRPPAGSVRAAARRAERRERRLRHHQGSRGRRADAAPRTSRSSTRATPPSSPGWCRSTRCPTLSTGTDRLFTPLAPLTQPRFQPSYADERHLHPAAESRPAPAAASAAAGGTGSAGTDGRGRRRRRRGVNVSFQGAVGPVRRRRRQLRPIRRRCKNWLTDNGYVVSDAAAALIDAYVRENKYFVALKLLNGVGVRSIQPIVLTFRGTEPCVPLRLTAIAANPDMPVLVWVLLGQARRCRAASTRSRSTRRASTGGTADRTTSAQRPGQPGRQRGGRQRVHHRVRGHRRTIARVVRVRQRPDRPDDAAAWR